MRFQTRFFTLVFGKNDMVLRSEAEQAIAELKRQNKVAERLVNRADLERDEAREALDAARNACDKALASRDAALAELRTIKGEKP